MTGSRGALRRRLPPGLVRRAARARAAVARRFGGKELQAMVQELSAAHSAEMAAAHQEMREHLKNLENESHARDLDLVADLLARQDAVLAGYDRRVAALTIRVLDLEARLGQPGPDPVDATALIDDHHPHGP